MQLIANQDKIIIEPWDYRYYAEKVRQKNMILTLMRLSNFYNWIN